MRISLEDRSRNAFRLTNSMNSKLLEHLTRPQRAAVTATEGPLLILAGPGSGKTRVMTVRLAYLLESGVPPYNLLGLTFTNKAADEMRQRLAELAPNMPIGVGTFHRFCSRLLRRYAHHIGLTENFSIYDSADSMSCLKSVVEEADINRGQYTMQQIARTISNAKNHLVTPEQFATNNRKPLEQVTAEIYPLYQAQLISANSLDFDDLLMQAALLLGENSVIRAELDEYHRYVMVDEYQDTNKAQYEIVKALAQDYPNLAVTGDPDQSIYGWRGADIRNILDFERDYPEVRVVRLEQNYRSTPNILRSADTLIANNLQRKKKSLFTENPEGEPVSLVNYATGRDESDDIANQIATWIRLEDRRARDVAILYRTNALSRALEHALQSEGVPYQIVNGVEFYQRKEIKDVLAYLHLVNNPRNDNALLRVVNTPPRGIGKKTLRRLRDHASQNGLSLLEAAANADRIQSISKRLRTSVLKFVEQFSQFVDQAAASVEEIVGLILSVTGYTDHLQHSGAEEDQERLANVQELLTAARQFDELHSDNDDGSLDGFLEQIALVNDTDAMDTECDKVTLMTLHAAKGLEFPAVYIIAMESGILPHNRSREDPLLLEEERRLMFVGMTRAQERLQLSFANRRHYRGAVGSTIPSSFLMELPREEMELSQFGEPTDDYTHEDYPHSVEGEDLRRKKAQQADTSSLTEPIGLTTAAEMAGDANAAASGCALPDDFRLSMVVTHPKHGLGKILALGGSGEKRQATVQFFQETRHRTIMLAFSKLQPVEGPLTGS